jgi:hypothetical protein
MMLGSRAGCKAASEIAAMTNGVFSSEVDTGSREENALKQKPGARF